MHARGLYNLVRSHEEIVLKKPLKILFVTSEVAPLMSTGGLADVASALPQALHAQGHDVRVIMPCFRSLSPGQRGEQLLTYAVEMGPRLVSGALRKTALPNTRVPLYLVEQEAYFMRPHPYGSGAHEYPDNAERFSFFCAATLEGIKRTGWHPDVVHCHDWHAAAVPALLKTRYEKDVFWGGTPSLFTIHNLAYQGRYSADRFAATGLPAELFTPEFLEFHGDFCLMKAGLVFSDKLSTVSPRYAREIQTAEYGVGLDGVLRHRAKDLHGILNGVDYTIWNPAKDEHLEANYDAANMAGKAACKAALQRALGLPVREVPVFGSVTRLFWQKGLDLVADAMPELLRHDLQVVVQGTGDPEVEQRLQRWAAEFPEKISLVLKFDRALAHQVHGGSDFFLMPSRYEPCGLSQMYSFAYGNIPIVRRTGGLADTVVHLDPVHRKNETSNGISFIPLTPQAITRAVVQAMGLYRTQEFLEVQKRGMAADFSWEQSAKAYDALYRETIAAV